MLHFMKLKPSPFEKIKSGRKTVELRLFDEKRRLVCVDDEIEFTNVQDETQKLRVKVVALHRYNSFVELYKDIPLEKCGYSKEEAVNASPHDMDAYYSQEEQSRYGVVGIEFEIVC